MNESESAAGMAGASVSAASTSFPQEAYLQALNSVFSFKSSNQKVTRNDVNRLATQFRELIPAEHLERAFQKANKELQRAGRKLGWQLLALPQYATVDRERSSIASLWLADNPVPDLEALLADNLSLPEDPAEAQGQALLSAIVNGGLVDRRWWQPFLQALGPARSAVELVGGRICLLLERDPGNERSPRQQSRQKALDQAQEPDGLVAAGQPAVPDHGNRQQLFWAADPMTEILIRRGWRAGKFGEHVPCQHALVAFHQNPDLSEKTLARAAADHLLLQVPPVLVSYAKGTLVTQDAAPETLAQLVTGRPLAQRNPSDPNEQAALSHQSGEAPKRSTQKPGESVMRQYKRLHAAMKRPDARGKLTSGKAADNIDVYVDGQSGALHPIILDLAYWCSSMLRPSRSPSADRKAYKVSTVKSYLSSVGPELIARVLTDDIVTWETREIEQLYEAIIAQDGLTAAEQGRRATALGLFHQSLQAHYPGAVDTIHSRAGASSSANVDANLVSLFAYQTALSLLSAAPAKTEGERRLCSLQVLVLMLGYRAGLRWSEASLIAVNEFVGTGREMELHIRVNDHRDVKSSAGRRVLPIGQMLNPHELHALESVLELRKREMSYKPNGRQDELLFADSSGVRLKARHLFNPVQNALRVASGNAEASYHHCRHAFASRILAMLLLRSMPEVWGELPGLGLTDEWCPNSPNAYEILPREPCSFSDQVDALRYWTIGREPCDRQVSYAVAQLVGHESPSTTFASYVHVMGWILGCRLSQARSQPDARIEQLAWLWPTGEASQRTLQRFRHPSGHPPDQEKRFLVHCLMKWRRRALSKNDQASPLPVVRSTRGRPRKAVHAVPPSIPAFPTMLEVHRILTSAVETDEVVLEGAMLSVAQLRSMAIHALSHSKAALSRLHDLRVPEGYDLTIAARLWESVAAAGNFAAPSRMDGLSRLWRHFRADRSIKLVGTTEQIKTFMDFIKQLGIPASQILLQHHTKRGFPATQAELMRRCWEDDLGLSEGRCVAAASHRAEHDSLSIKVVEQHKDGRDPSASSGFLYGALLLFIAGTWQKRARQLARQPAE